MAAASIAVLAVVLLTLLGLAVWRRDWVRRTVVEFFGAVDGPFNLAVARIAFFATVLLWGLPEPQDVRPYTQLPHELIVAPSNLGAALAHLPLTTGLVDASYIVMLVASLLGLIGLFPRLSAAALVVAGFYYLGIPQLFGKVAHYHHVLWIGVVFACSPSADALSVQAIVKAWRRPATEAVGDVERSRAYALPLRFIWLLMGLLYLSAGLAKYRFDGLRWLDPATLGHWLHLVWYQNGHLPALIHRPDQVAPLLALGAAFTIVFECGWLLLVFHRSTRRVLVAAGLIFHNATGWLMGVPFLTLQGLYVTLVDWDGVSRRAFRRRAPVVFAYDGNCGICKRTVVALRACALPGSIQFVEGLDCRHLHVVAGGRTYTGFYAYRRAARRIPALWPALPFLYLPPFVALGKRIERRLADGHPREVHTTAAPSRRRRTAPLAIAASVIAVAVFVNGMLGLRSLTANGRATDGWPVASYPSFAGVGDSTTSVLAMYSPTPQGRIAVDFHGRLRFMDRGRVFGLLDKLVNYKTGDERRAAISALINLTRPTLPSGRVAHTIVVVRERRDLHPGSGGRVLSHQDIGTWSRPP